MMFPAEQLLTKPQNAVICLLPNSTGIAMNTFWWNFFHFMMTQHKDFRVNLSLAFIELIMRFHHIFDEAAFEDENLACFWSWGSILFLLGDISFIFLDLIKDFSPMFDLFLISSLIFQPFLCFATSIVQTVFIVGTFGALLWFLLASNVLSFVLGFFLSLYCSHFFLATFWKIDLSLDLHISLSTSDDFDH